MEISLVTKAFFRTLPLSFAYACSFPNDLQLSLVPVCVPPLNVPKEALCPAKLLFPIRPSLAPTSCRKRIRKTKALLALNLAPTVKDDKKCLFTKINNKGVTRKISVLYWMRNANMVMKGEENSELINAFFASNFDTQTGYAEVEQPP